MLPVLRTKIMLERKRKEIEKKGMDNMMSVVEGESSRSLSQITHVNEDDIRSDEDLASEMGLWHPKTIDVDELKREKERLSSMIAEQRQKRAASKRSYLEWQAGQREKGSSYRLTTTARREERYKRSLERSGGARLISVAYRSPLGDNTNNSMSVHRQDGTLRHFQRGNPTKLLIEVQDRSGTYYF